MKQYNLGVTMTKYERILGWVFLPFYVCLLAILLSIACALLGWEPSDVQLNAVYFAINIVVILLIFHRFLWNSLGGIPKKFWLFVQALILGFVLYYASVIVLGLLYSWLFPDLVNLNNESVETLATSDYGLTVVFTVIIAPIVEETLMRGLVFGSIQRKSRVWAYIVSMLLFASLHVWQYVGAASVGTILLCAVEYLPAGVALGWTYEKAGNLWAAIFLHMIINAISIGLMAMPIG